MSDWYHVKPDGSAVSIGDGIGFARNGGSIMQPIDERRLAATEVRPDCSVSTVFLGLDHGYGDGPPVLWETMVFCADCPELDNDGERYTSQTEAQAGHERWVNRLRIALGIQACG